MLQRIQSALKVVPDFPPNSGIKYFYDIGTLLRDPQIREETWDMMYSQVKHLPIDVVCGIDSRGFITCTSLTSREHCNVGMVMVRKASSLPGPVHSVQYNLEYRNGSTLQLQKSDNIKPGQRVLISDDLAATGGSLLAAVQLIREAGGIVVGCSVIVELIDLECALKLADHGVRLFSVLQMNKDNVNVTVPIEKPLRTIFPLPSLFKMVLFFHPSCRSLANAIRFKYDREFDIIEASWEKFPDGSPNLDFFTDRYSIGKDILFLGNLESLDDVLEQQVFLIALSRQGLRSLTISYPFLKTATDERIEHPGKIAFVEPFARLLSSSSLQSTSTGLPHIQLFDVHATPTQFYFEQNNVRVHMLTATSLIMEIIKKKTLELTKTDPKNKVLIAFPDDGAYKRFHNLFEELGLDFVICVKVRRGNTRSIMIREGSDYENVKYILLVDDLVQTGGTLHECRLVLQQTYPEALISAYVTHGVFPHDSWRKFLPGEVYGGFHKFYVTNTIGRTCNKLYNRPEVFHVLDICDLIVENTFRHVRSNFDNHLPRTHTTISVASTNKEKANAVKDAVDRIFGSSKIHYEYHDIKSGVSEQPMLREGLIGCKNRLHRLIEDNPFDNHFFISLENGGVKTHKGISDTAFVGLCYGKNGQQFFTSSPLVRPPIKVVEEALLRGITFGQVLEERLGTPRDNWQAMYDVLGRDRATLMSLAVQEAITHYLQLHY